MFNLIKRLLSGPQLADEDQTRAARLLNTTLLITLGVLVVSIINTAALTDIADDFLGINTLFITLSLGLLWAVWHGYVRLSSWVVCWLIWGVIVLVAYLGQGLLSPVFMGSFLVIVTAGFLLGAQVALFFTGLSIATGTFFLIGAVQGRYPEMFGLVTAQIAWADYIGVFIFLGLIVAQWARATRQALQRARSNERVVTEHNQLLQREIAERKQVEYALREAEQALRASEERFRVALASAPIVVFNQDRDLRYTWVYNPKWMTEASLIGKHDRDFMPVESVAPITAIKQSVLDTGAGRREEVAVDRDGMTHYFDFTVEPLRDATGAIIGITAATFDISEQKHAQYEAVQNERLRVEVEKNRKLVQMKQDFITMVSHEFRTPLTIIHSSKDLLQHYHTRMSEAHRDEHLVRIGVQVHKMVEMLDNILLLSSASAGMLEFQPKLLNVRVFCRSVFDEFTSRHAGKFELSFTCADACDTTIAIDERLLRPALLNLLANAAKYSHAGGLIAFSVECDESEALLHVTDYGIGIPPDDHEKLFEPFYRAHNVRDIGGVGLGLAITKNNLSVHGAMITVESREGAGTTFTVHLPLTHDLDKTA
jgi:PAS domain S-box-containing protein